MYTKISKCRISGSKTLTPILNLGNQCLTGVFPKNASQNITKGPLELVWCPDSNLLQLNHSYDQNEMYGNNYGYRSSLNQSMVKHLELKANYLEKKYLLSSDDLVIDIGSNDATFLKSYSNKKFKKIGIDPIGRKFQQHYGEQIKLIPDFFSSKILNKYYNEKKAKLITSIAMFYDLEDPLEFISAIYQSLAPDGIWHFEQSYMPLMLKMNSYDTICHEHLEYYSLSNVKDLLEKCDMKIIDVQINSINGGSFAVTACKKKSFYEPNHSIINSILKSELSMNLATLRPFKQFNDNIIKHKNDLKKLLEELISKGKKIIGYGASTKGNVLLQFCNLSEKELTCIAEVNEEKFGSFTPCTNIPIVSEKEAKLMKPDYMLVLPWHFKENIIIREKDYLRNGGKLIIPLPEIEII